MEEDVKVKPRRCAIDFVGVNLVVVNFVGVDFVGVAFVRGALSAEGGGLFAVGMYSVEGGGLVAFVAEEYNEAARGK